MQDTRDESNAPHFGLIDLVDAFTAFRHEYRTQAKESRATAELLQTVTRQLEQIANTLQSPTLQSPTLQSPTLATLARPTTQPHASPPDDAVRAEVCHMLIELDIQWTRAVESVQRSEQLLQQQALSGSQAFDAAVAALSPLRRWLAGPLIRTYRQSQATMPKLSNSTPISEGLSIVLAKLRQVLQDHGVQRMDTQGQPFDGQLMRSISSVAEPSIPSGHVAQQLSPAYLRHGQVLKYADVRVAT